MYEQLHPRLGWKLTIDDISLGIQPVLLGMALTATTLEIQLVGPKADTSV
jgi:hypothetical protein